MATHESNVTTPWKHPWTMEEIVNSSRCWSLAADYGVCELMKQFSTDFLNEVAHLNSNVMELCIESKQTNVTVQNAFNDFCLLANDHFMENLVEQVESGPATKTNPSDTIADSGQRKEDKMMQINSQVSEAIRLGMEVLDTQFEILDMQRIRQSESGLSPREEAISDMEDEGSGSLSDDRSRQIGTFPSTTLTNGVSDGDRTIVVGGGVGAEGSEYLNAEPIYHPRDPYEHRHLPHLIGTADFVTDDTLGIGFLDDQEDEIEDEDDDDEEEEEEAVKGKRKKSLSKDPLSSSDFSDDSSLESIKQSKKDKQYKSSSSSSSLLASLGSSSSDSISNIFGKHDNSTGDLFNDIENFGSSKKKNKNKKTRTKKRKNEEKKEEEEGWQADKKTANAADEQETMPSLSAKKPLTLQDQLHNQLKRRLGIEAVSKEDILSTRSRSSATSFFSLSDNGEDDGVEEGGRRREEKQKNQEKEQKKTVAPALERKSKRTESNSEDNSWNSRNDEAKIQGTLPLKFEEDNDDLFAIFEGKRGEEDNADKRTKTTTPKPGFGAGKSLNIFGDETNEDGDDDSDADIFGDFLTKKNRTNKQTITAIKTPDPVAGSTSVLDSNRSRSTATKTATTTTMKSTDKNTSFNTPLDSDTDEDIFNVKPSNKEQRDSPVLILAKSKTEPSPKTVDDKAQKKDLKLPSTMKPLSTIFDDDDNSDDFDDIFGNSNWKKISSTTSSKKDEKKTNDDEKNDSELKREKEKVTEKEKEQERKRETGKDLDSKKEIEKEKEEEKEKDKEDETERQVEKEIEKENEKEREKGKNKNEIVEKKLLSKTVFQSSDEDDDEEFLFGKRGGKEIKVQGHISLSTTSGNQMKPFQIEPELLTAEGKDNDNDEDIFPRPRPSIAKKTISDFEDPLQPRISAQPSKPSSTSAAIAINNKKASSLGAVIGPNEPNKKETEKDKKQGNEDDNEDPDLEPWTTGEQSQRQSRISIGRKLPAGAVNLFANNSTNIFQEIERRKNTKSNATDVIGGGRRGLSFSSDDQEPVTTTTSNKNSKRVDNHSSSTVDDDGDIFKELQHDKERQLTMTKTRTMNSAFSQQSRVKEEVEEQPRRRQSSSSSAGRGGAAPTTPTAMPRTIDLDTTVAAATTGPLLPALTKSRARNVAARRHRPSTATSASSSINNIVHKPSSSVTDFFSTSALEQGREERKEERKDETNTTEQEKSADSVRLGVESDGDREKNNVDVGTRADERREGPGQGLDKEEEEGKPFRSGGQARKQQKEQRNDGPTKILDAVLEKSPDPQPQVQPQRTDDLTADIFSNLPSRPEKKKTKTKTTKAATTTPKTAVTKATTKTKKVVDIDEIDDIFDIPGTKQSKKAKSSRSKTSASSSTKNSVDKDPLGAT